MTAGPNASGYRRESVDVESWQTQIIGTADADCSGSAKRSLARRVLLAFRTVEPGESDGNGQKAQSENPLDVCISREMYTCPVGDTGFEPVTSAV
jgi:hypothetical protein